MPVFFHKEVFADTIIALWKMDEPFDDFLKEAQQKKINCEEIVSMKLELRKKQWLGIRLLINFILGENTDIEYNENGKPSLSDGKHISISHSSQFVAVIISKNKNVGIDVEEISPRIERITHKFMSEKELANVENDSRYLHYYLNWCSKESICKLFDNRKFIFNRELRVDHNEILKRGFFNAEADIYGKTELLLMNYIIFDNCILVWTLK